MQLLELDTLKVFSNYFFYNVENPKNRNDPRKIKNITSWVKALNMFKAHCGDVFAAVWPFIILTIARWLVPKLSQCLLLGWIKF
jgi:hypothetical protein